MTWIFSGFWWLLWLQHYMNYLLSYYFAAPSCSRLAGVVHRSRLMQAWTDDDARALETIDCPKGHGLDPHAKDQSFAKLDQAVGLAVDWTIPPNAKYM